MASYGGGGGGRPGYPVYGYPAEKPPPPGYPSQLPPQRAQPTPVTGDYRIVGPFPPASRNQPDEERGRPFENCAYLSSSDPLAARQARNVVINDKFVIMAGYAYEVPSGRVQLNTLGMYWMGVKADSKVTVKPFVEATAKLVTAGVLRVTVCYSSKQFKRSSTYEHEYLKEAFLTCVSGRYVQLNQEWAYMSGARIGFRFRVDSILATNNGEAVMMSDDMVTSISRTSEVQVRVENNQVPFTITGAPKSAHRPMFDPAKVTSDAMNVGGLKKELDEIFRRAFNSRLFPPELIERMGVRHVKGILLYGPPGTGKTLIARELSKLITTNEAKVVNGPEILNKYVGQSEENVRKLFAEAEAEFKQSGNHSSTHVIIIDEIDAICKTRGSSGGDTGVGDNVVNQLLTKMDGINQLPNVIVIGMTNRKDRIDEALLRPGRFEVQIEIPLPTEDGRVDILKRVVKAADRDGMIDQNSVDIEKIARGRLNFSGAELVALWNSASSYAQQRVLPQVIAASQDPSTKAEIHIQVVKEDFDNAVLDVKAIHCTDLETISQPIKFGYIEFSPEFKAIPGFTRVIRAFLKNDSKKPGVYPILIHGHAKSGTTALACHVARETDCPFVQLVQPADFMGMGPAQRISKLQTVFELAYKSKESILVIDDIERIVGWMRLGSRFMSDVVAALTELLRVDPPKTHRLGLIVTTKDRSALRSLEMLGSFRGDFEMPLVNSIERLQKVLSAVGIGSRYAEPFYAALQNQDDFLRWKMGIKAVTMVLEDAVPDRVATEASYDRFANGMATLMKTVTFSSN